MRDAKKSIVDSLARIMKFNYKEIAEDQIILARVVTVYSDILDPETFGTMDCYDEKNKIEIPDIPLNAHINDDGTSGISGKYTFPKVGSDIYLALDIGVNRETFIPILFSHIDKVYESYNEEKIVEVIEVDTPDPNKPYETEASNTKTKRAQSATELRSDANETTGGSFRKQNYDDIHDSMGNNDGEISNHQQTPLSIVNQVKFQNLKDVTSSITQDGYSVEVAASGVSTEISMTPSKISIDGGTGVQPEPAVMGDTLQGLIEDLIDAINGIGTIVATTGTAAAQTGTGTVDPASQAQLNIIKAQLSSMKNLKIDLS
tara:strand:- start:6137 stop:7087 length:951 start_codon:yes stop_codon:yes gene_type:complete